jgi:hypothetical protein
MKQAPIQLDPETLVAYVDKELAPERAEAVAAALVHDGDARETVRLLRLSAAAGAHAFDRALSDPMPSRLLQTIGAASGSSSRRRPTPQLRRLWPLAASLAALALGLAGGYALGGSGLFHAQAYVPAAASDADPLAAAFESALLPALDSGREGQSIAYAGTGADKGEIRIGRAFTTGFGGQCRELTRSQTRAGTASRDSGIACRAADQSWSVMLLPAGQP